MPTRGLRLLNIVSEKNAFLTLLGMDWLGFILLLQAKTAVLMRAGRGPISSFPIAFERSLHARCVSTNGALIVERNLSGDVKSDVIAGKGAIDGSRLPRALECAAYLSTLLLDHECLLGTATAIRDRNGPYARDVGRAIAGQRNSTKQQYREPCIPH